MKRIAALGLAVVFAVCMIHFFYAEDHCPVHCPIRAGRFGHVHPHHPGALVCLCFWASLIGPETDAPTVPVSLLAVLAHPAGGHLLCALTADITPPPRPSFV
jgi:hypothetical protein